MHASLFCCDISNPKAVSILYVGGTVGALIGGSLCDRFGRKVTIMLTDVVFILGAILL
jgi:MFS family permease